MLVLDAGALVAIERSHRETIALLARERAAGRSALTHAGVLGQVWRGGRGRQAKLARVLPALLVLPVDEDLGRRAGVLLGQARRSDVIDAAVVLLASDGDMILTSDPRDLRPLADAAGLDVDIVEV